MEVLIFDDPAAVGRAAADRIANLVRTTPDAVLGLATGSSPQATYEALAEDHRAGLDFSRVRGFALDEYVGLSPDDTRRYAHVIHESVTIPLGMDAALVQVPNGDAEDLVAACEEYEAQIASAGGVDLQILGIGSNGHIGFNEPMSSFQSRTRIKTLAPSTRADNARFFDDASAVPTHCLTQGLGTILRARELVLVAQGAGKARAVATALEGPVAARTPASILQWHPRATVILDRAAASELEFTSYYEHAANTPVVTRGRLAGV